jgi:hypothetical protein
LAASAFSSLFAPSQGIAAELGSPPDWTLTQGMCPRIEGAIEDTLKAASLHHAEGDKEAVSVDLQLLAINLGQMGRLGCGDHFPDPATLTRYANQAHRCVTDRAAGAAPPASCNMRDWRPEE